MAKSVLLKLFIGIIIVLIISIPELMKTLQVNTVTWSCVDACFCERSYLSTVVNTSFLCILIEDEGNVTSSQLESLMNQRQTISATIRRKCANSSHDHSEQLDHPLEKLTYAERQIQDDKTNSSLEIKGKYLLHSYKKLHFVLVSSGEDEQPGSPLFLEVHIANVTEYSFAPEPVASSDQTDEIANHQNIINISLEFYTEAPYYTSTLGVIWLALLPAIFFCAVVIFVYKLVTKNRSG